MFSYDAEFIKLNVTGIKYVQEDLLEGESKYYILNGGLIQIIDKLEELCKNLKILQS